MTSREVLKVWQKTVGSECQWAERYAVIEEDGKLIMFEDLTQPNPVNTYDLSLWTTGNVKISSTDPKSKPFRLSLETDEGAVHFAFDSKQERDHLAAKITMFITKDIEDEKDQKDDKESGDRKIIMILIKQMR